MSIDRIDDRIRERSLLTHAFYQQWSMGTLSRDALAGYAREYFALVKAVPGMMQPMVGNAPIASSPTAAMRSFSRTCSSSAGEDATSGGGGPGAGHAGVSGRTCS